MSIWRLVNSVLYPVALLAGAKVGSQFRTVSTRIGPDEDFYTNIKVWADRDPERFVSEYISELRALHPGKFATLTGENLNQAKRRLAVDPALRRTAVEEYMAGLRQIESTDAEAFHEFKKSQFIIWEEELDRALTESRRFEEKMRRGGRLSTDESSRSNYLIRNIISLRMRLGTQDEHQRMIGKALGIKFPKQ